MSIFFIVSERFDDVSYSMAKMSFEIIFDFDSTEYIIKSFIWLLLLPRSMKLKFLKILIIFFESMKPYFIISHKPAKNSFFGSDISSLGSINTAFG